jgi:AcrR family transcriptional regulator
MSSGDPETRERILMATWQLMEQKRGQNVRLEDIAQVANVSRQAIYMHFGSRAGLLIETTHFLDKRLNLETRTKPVYDAPNALQALEAYIEFWTNYLPDIYGLAKALLIARDTDKAAAAAWEDRMTAVRRGCNGVIRRLDKEGILITGWTVDEATDFFWTVFSVAHWENLTLECGWTHEQYVQHMKRVLKQILVSDSKS